MKWLFQKLIALVDAHEWRLARIKELEAERDDLKLLNKDLRQRAEAAEAKLAEASKP